MVGLLLDAGATVAEDARGGRLITQACGHQGGSRALARLLKAGAPVNRSFYSYQERTALYVASQHLSPRMVTMLLSAGADPNAPSGFNKETPLHLASPRCAAELVRQGADIDGATDINADIVDADLFIIDDGAGGTNRKTTASRIKTYIGGGTQWQAVKTGNYTASAGQGVFANTTSSAFTVTLPSGTLGDEVTIVDYAGTFDSNALTVAADGSEKIFGSTDDLTVSTERAAFTLVFTDSTQGWLFKND